ncbi:pirin family protein [Paracnuella aquatica]|uniref:pirin family protein n=1 Tax=Paracnuella aquatica TaxID=2268757 RepID=UPI000DEFF3F5|nr:pirin family protein [Paracnuella aquatica]RPD51629.1 pirin family protein [Paracnuella aquatica]
MSIQKPVNAIYRAGYTDYDRLDTYRVMPSRNVTMDMMDPFIFLNHHGPQVYPPNNAGLPFGPHPHKGFETVTIIVTGDLVHQDSTGFNSNIKAGGIQWMTAGAGIIHSETSSEEFKASGGPVEILQLWVNLPARLKGTPPAYTGLQHPEIPHIVLENGVQIDAVSGTWADQKGALQSLSDVQLATVALQKNASWSLTVGADRNVLFYVIRGKLSVNGSEAEANDLVVFNAEGTVIQVQASEDALVLIGHAMPNKEPIAAHGPFVMNTQEEIRKAFVDYQQGKFGVWNH